MIKKKGKFLNSLHFQLFVSIAIGTFIAWVSSLLIRISLVNFFDTSDEAVLHNIWLVSSFAYTVIFIVVLLLMYSHRIIKSIRRLSKQTEIITNGDFNEKIQLKGGGELSLLADNVDTMRCSLIERMESEKKAWGANQELLTSISHDIRTPLTSLLGYIDVINNGQYNSEEEMKQYLGVCKDKAYQLKGLTDDLFRYFLLFGNQEFNVEKTCVNASIFLSQLIGERSAHLSLMGYNVFEDIFYNADYCVNVDIDLMSRIFDNVFSNMQKYADINKQIRITAKKERKYIRIKTVNSIKYTDNPIQSTRIGLKTCEKLCAAMGIEFSYFSKADEFVLEMLVPVCVADN